MNLPKLAVHRPVTTVMLLVSVMVVGAIAVVRLPQAFLPDVDAPFIGIEVPYPNSNPTQIEKEIVKPIEEVLSTLPSIKRLYSTSSADGAFFELEFDWGQEIDLVRMAVSEKMEQIEPELPSDLGAVRIFSFSTADIPVIQGRLSATGVDLSESYELIESRIVNRLRRVPGVARVDLGGVAPKEISIDLVLDRVVEHGVDVGELIPRLRGATASLVLGEVRDGGLRYTARGLGAFDSVESLAALPIDARGARLGDVAEITYEEPPIAYGRHLDGDFAVALEIFKESTANTVEVVEAATAVIENEIGTDPLLQGVRLFVWEDQAKAITNGINGLTKAGLAGSLLALLCLWFFLRRLDSTLIVSMSIPFSILAACGVMYFMGKTLNILSMMGLILGVGMLVDNAVVVLENIVRHREEGRSRLEAARLGTSEVGTAITAATLTSVAVFFPMVFITGIAGQLFRDQALTVSFSLLFSLIVAMTLVPMLAAGKPEFQVPDPDRKPGRIGLAIAQALALKRRLTTRVSDFMAWLFGFLARPTQSGFTAVQRATGRRCSQRDRRSATLLAQELSRIAH
jgi:HAE1 family hydrophobic/amphiphilic exporter-1